VPGNLSAYATAGFQRALANPQTIGMFCSGSFVSGEDYLHELFNPTFSMLSFAVCDPPRARPTSDFADAPSAKQENEACAQPLSFSR
jgi:hypothetical protein